MHFYSILLLENLHMSEFFSNFAVFLKQLQEI